MEQSKEQVLQRALGLDAGDREWLLGRLLGSPDVSAETAFEGSWAEEIQRRIEAIRAGSATGRPWPEGKEELSAQLSAQLSVQPSAQPSAGTPRLYSEFASWWPLLSAPIEYEEEARIYAKLLLAGCEQTPRTVLELGSGGGNNASHLKERFEMTLVDRSPDMLAVSRALNPECEHLEGDMRTVRLGRVFDAVFVHDAIVYMLTESNLRQAIETAFLHCRPGGAALFAPDLIRENFRSSTGHGGHDGQAGDLRGVRYLSWTWDPDPSDTTYIADYAYMLRESDGTIRVEHDRHTEGLFPRADWLRLLSEVGFRPSVVPFEHSEVEYGVCELFVGRKPLV